MEFEPYGDPSRASGVTGYKIGPDFIALRFTDDVVYVYDYGRPGWNHVERMKMLARSGRGLTTYVNQHVRDSYARREH